MAKEANFGFLAIFSGGRPFFSVIFPGVQAVLLSHYEEVSDSPAAPPPGTIE